MITVFQMDDDPYLAKVVVSIITRMGMYLNETQAKWLIAQGKVSVDGEVQTNEATILRPGFRNFVIGSRKVAVDLREVTIL